MPVKRCYQLFGGNRAGYSARARDLVTYTLTNLRMQEVGVLLRLANISIAEIITEHLIVPV